MIPTTHTLRAAPGTLLTANTRGFAVANQNTGMSFVHPFRPVLVGSDTGVGLRFTRGLVDGFEPKIGAEPMSGTLGKLPPILALSPSAVNAATGESWAVLEATPNDKGVIDVNSKLVIIHGSAPGGSTGGTVARTPVALIVWNGKTPVMVWPVLFFNLRYVRRTSDNGPVQHFFL